MYTHACRSESVLLVLRIPMEPMGVSYMAIHLPLKQ